MTLARGEADLGLRVDQARKLEEPERENTRLKKLIAYQAPDIEVLDIYRRAVTDAWCACRSGDAAGPRRV